MKVSVWHVTVWQLWCGLPWANFNGFQRTHLELIHICTALCYPIPNNIKITKQFFTVHNPVMCACEKIY